MLRPCWKSHLKQLQIRGKQRKFTTVTALSKEEFPEIENVECLCQVEVKAKRRKDLTKDEKPKKFKFITCKAGCGCLTDTFCQRAKNGFSNILSTSQFASEFSRRLRGLVHHVQDEHQWVEERACDEHDLTVCEVCKFEYKNTEYSCSTV